MANRKNIFPEEVELSEIVLKKTNHAFEMIQREDICSMKKTNMKGTKLWKSQVAAAVGICLLAACSISAAAAIHHYWGRGMNGNIQASDAQQQALTKQKVAKVYSEEMDFASLAVTDHGVTVVPDLVIADERFAYMSFCISGYSVADGMQPGFGMVRAYFGDDPEADGAWVNINGGKVYDGIICNENGKPVYEDGTPVKYDENGRIICYYTDSDGNMEYIIWASVADRNDSLLGRKLHVDFENLGTLERAAFTPVLDGNWNFEIDLPDVSLTQNIKVGQEVGETGFTMEDIAISPISMKVNYSVSTAPERKEGDLVIPWIRGVVLKDGTRMPYLTDAGSIGYEPDGDKYHAYQITGFEKVIDVDEVAALIARIPDTKEDVEIPISLQD